MTHHFRQNLCAEISVIIRTLHIVLKFSPFKRSGSFSETATKGFLPDNERSLFAFCEFWIGIFKAVNLPYPTVTVISELLLLLFLSCTECIRILLGRNGNLTERSVVLLVSVGLTIPSICGVLYFLLWQTYVLRLEVVLCAIQLTLQGLELAAALLCLAKFYKSVHRHEVAILLKITKAFS
ncbi:hypothetical protein Cfor_07685 [Coptotermes formosanus]|uniref:Transmembrane protein n=1 Tax=Coptotermes formosanus TaxID=36987 RepID=A0A6L2PQ93_COPFO|nr:hypothetical protein Cfor_07685 [Coptotermes formosanus]